MPWYEDTQKLPNSKIDDTSAELYFPVKLVDGQPVTTVNGVDYPVTGMVVDAYVRDTNNENLFWGTAEIDLDALMLLLFGD